MCPTCVPGPYRGQKKVTGMGSRFSPLTAEPSLQSRTVDFKERKVSLSMISIVDDFPLAAQRFPHWVDFPSVSVEVYLLTACGNRWGDGYDEASPGLIPELREQL